MISLNFKSIKQHLDDKNLNFQVQPGTDQLLTLFQYEGKEFPLFIRIDEKSQMLQFLVFLPHALTPTTKYGEVARLLHYLNREIDLPGFCLDENAGMLFYRYVILAPDRKISADLIDQLVASLPRVVAVFFPLIVTVATSMLTFEHVLPSVQETLKKFALK